MPCLPTDCSLLRKIGLRAFTEAFAAQNNKADFDSYVAKAFDPALLALELETQASEFYFAKIGGQVAGYLKLNHPPVQEEDFGNNCLEIQRIYSLAAYYGCGVGVALLKKAFGISREHGYDFVWLGVWEENHRAIRFYHKHGFEVFGSHPFLFGTDLQTDLLMRVFM
ncbi:MAG: GNAT family N-acetyltransferase [Saprospiraceae bacterium]|nr:GNAT family N-acetyltransferase [Saprospiraceae bacterium]